MGAVFMTCGHSVISEHETNDQVSLKAPRSRTLTAPSLIRTTTTVTATSSRTGTLLCKSPSSLNNPNEPLILPLPPIPCPSPPSIPIFPTTPTPAPVSVTDTTTEVSMQLSSQRGSLADSEMNPLPRNVAEGSDEDEVLGTNIPRGSVGLPSTSQSDGNLCVRARRVVLLDEEQQQQQQDHSQHRHHHHHRHNHSYHGQQQQHCCARFGSGDSGSSKHRLHSNSCVLV
ncbi:hypothetical protein L798_11458 [Zootermopsis nevadensis]|uniref:Uncharacterized protein n=2 Tax=Zootermopsis nevadensis TaxID=136037 RepID=A0A067QYT8_ZOONE|nr:hypothetical protein L798_11458 [Zootermopsis nevadensis]